MNTLLGEESVEAAVEAEEMQEIRLSMDDGDLEAQDYHDFAREIKLWVVEHKNYLLPPEGQLGEDYEVCAEDLLMELAPVFSEPYVVAFSMDFYHPVSIMLRHNHFEPCHFADLGHDAYLIVFDAELVDQCVETIMATLKPAAEEIHAPSPLPLPQIVPSPPPPPPVRKGARLKKDD